MGVWQVKAIARCPWAVTHLFPSFPGGAVLGLVSPAPPNASWLLLLNLRAKPLPPAYSIAFSTRAASKVGAGGGKGEGWGGTGEEEYERGKKTERPAGQGMTSLPSGSEGAGTTLPGLRPPAARWGRCYELGEEPEREPTAVLLTQVP